MKKDVLTIAGNPATEGVLLNVTPQGNRLCPGAVRLLERHEEPTVADAGQLFIVEYQIGAIGGDAAVACIKGERSIEIDDLVETFVVFNLSTGTDIDGIVECCGCMDTLSQVLRRGPSCLRLPDEVHWNDLFGPLGHRQGHGCEEPVLAVG